MEDRKYQYFSLLPSALNVSGQLHGQTALSLVEEPPASFEYEFRWSLQRVRTLYSMWLCRSCREPNLNSSIFSIKDPYATHAVDEFAICDKKRI
jgi:hypothetical protein